MKRLDGREPRDMRPVEINTGINIHAEGSALNRLAKMLSATSAEIGKNLTLDDENSALARLRRELGETLEKLGKRRGSRAAVPARLEPGMGDRGVRHAAPCHQSPDAA